jgi:hypothetical protein
VEGAASDVGNVVGKVGSAGLNLVKHLAEQRSTGAELRRDASTGNEALVAKNAPKVEAAGIPLALPGTNIPGQIERGVKNVLPNAKEQITHTLPALATSGFNVGKDVVTGKEGKAASEVVKLGKGMGEGVVNTLEHPGKSWEKEPVSTAMMFGGAEYGVGSKFGDLMRSGNLGDKAAELASTKRPDLQFYNAESLPREYSKDVIRKGMQGAVDKVRQLKGDTNVNLAKGTRLQRHLYGGGIVGQTAQSLGLPIQGWFKPGLVDKAQAAFTDVRNMYKRQADGVMRGAKQAVPKGSREAIPLAFEGVIRRADTAKADLETRLSTLQDAAKELKGRELKLNRNQQERIQGLLSDKTFLENPKAPIEASDQLQKYQQPMTNKKIQMGALERDQEHAKNMPYAIQHMGARYNDAPGPHPLVSEISSLSKEADRQSSALYRARTKVADAEKLHPTVPNDHPVAVARQALKDAELSKARVEGGLKGAKSLDAKTGLADAKKAYVDAKAAHLQDQIAARDKAKYDAMDARNNVNDAKVKLSELKATGKIRNNKEGEMWPRLEVPNSLHDLEVDSVEKTMAHRQQLAKFAKATRERSAGDVADAEWEAEKARTEDTAEARDDGIAKVQEARKLGPTAALIDDIERKIKELNAKSFEYEKNSPENRAIRVEVKQLKAQRQALMRPLENPEIRAHMEKNLGSRDVGFLTHKETTTYSMHSKSGMRPPVASMSRTGEAFRTGAYDNSLDALHRQLRKDGGDVAAHESRSDMMRRFGIGSFADEQAAKEAAKNFNHTALGEQFDHGLGPMRVVNAGPDQIVKKGAIPAFGAEDALAKLTGSKTLGDAENAVHHAINETNPEGKYRLLPEAVADRIEEHDELASPNRGHRTMQALTNKWRNVNLYTNPHWPVGIAQENMVRLAISGINPFAAFGVGTAVKLGSSIIGHGKDDGSLVSGFTKIALDPNATDAQRFVARSQIAAIDTGNQFGGYVSSAVHRDMADVGAVREGMDAFNSHTGLAQMYKGWNGFKGFVAHGLEKMGANTRKAMLGKIALQEVDKFSKDWYALLKRQDDAVNAYAQRKLTPAQSVKLGDDINKMVGNWNALTPRVRSMTQTYAPFALWYINSMKFIFQTLPTDHPYKTAALTALISATKPLQKEPPKAGYLEGGIGINLPIAGNVTLEVSKYSPFGIGVEPWKTALGIGLAPTITGAALKSVGIDSQSFGPTTKEFGEAKIPEGQDLLKTVLNMPEEYVPGVRPVEAILKKGGKENPQSLNPIATLPGTQTGLPEALVKEFTPIPFIAGKKKSAGGLAKEGRLSKEAPLSKEGSLAKEPPLAGR